MAFQFQSVASVAPFLTVELGLDNAQLGWLIGLYLLPGAVIALPSGLLGARFGDKRLTLVSLGLMAVGGAGLAAADSTFAANAARLCSGAGAVMLNVLLTKMVADWFDGKERVLAMSILINAWPIGIAFALLVAGPLAEVAGWRLAMATTALFAAGGSAAVALMYRPPSFGATTPVPTGIGLSVLTRSEWRLLVIASSPWLFYNAAYQVTVAFLPAFFLETGLGIARSGAITALNTAALIVSVQAGGIILRRARHPDLVCHLAIVGWCVTLLLLSGGSVPLVWIVLGGLLAGLPASAYVTLPAEFLRPESRAAGMGVFYTIYYSGCAVLPVTAGIVYDLVGSARPTLWLASFFAFACVPGLMLFRRALRRVGG